MRLTIGNLNPTTGAVTINNPTLLESLITSDVNDGSTYSGLDLHAGQVGATKNAGGTIITWSAGTFMLEAVSSTCGSGDCKRIAYEVNLDGGTGELFRTLTPGGGGMGLGLTNTCTGHNCASCTFTKENGQITGCDCAKPGTGIGTATCDHTISQTT